MACDDFLTICPITLGPTIRFKHMKQQIKTQTLAQYAHIVEKLSQTSRNEGPPAISLHVFKAVITCLVSHCLLPNTPQLYTAQKSAIKIAAENSSLFMMSDCVTMRLINFWQSECGIYQEPSSVT